MHHETPLEWLERECERVRSFEELAEVGRAELLKFHNGSGFVCGPISTGGLGNMERNNEVFHAVIAKLRMQGHDVFNQMPYERTIVRLRSEWHAQDLSHIGQYCWPILKVFYATVFATGRINQTWFIPGWQGSTGAVWEHEHFMSANVDRTYLTDEFIREALVGYRGFRFEVR